MINARELRTGNLISDFDDGVGAVLAIDTSNGGDYVMTTANDLMLPIDNYSPIAITPTWLIDFGFSLSNIKIKNAGKVWVNGSFSFNPESSKSKHVHQLQNLYFALTGEELKLKQ